MVRIGKDEGFMIPSCFLWHDIPINTALMFSFLGFWATSKNGFIFPFVTMIPTLLDIVTIAWLLVKGE